MRGCRGGIRQQGPRPAPSEDDELGVVAREQVSRLERELATLQVQIKAVEETYGLDNLRLTVERAHLANLLRNAQVVRWLAQHRPEHLSGFQTVAELTPVVHDAPGDIALASDAGIHEGLWTKDSPARK